MSTVDRLTTQLLQIPPFATLPAAVMDGLVAQVQPLRYRMGQPIALRETMPAQVAILCEGQARLLGYPSDTALPETIVRLEPGAIIGATSLIRGIACETVLAAIESVCLLIPASQFQALQANHPEFAQFFERPLLVEVYDLLKTECQRQAIGGRVLDMGIAAVKLHVQIHSD